MTRTSRLWPIAAAAFLAVAAAGAASAQIPTIATAKFDPSLHVNLKACKKTPGGVYYQDLKIGTGALVTKGKSPSVKYDGRLVNGTQFDATRPGAPAITFTLGENRVVAGWEEGLIGMKVGGKRQLIIPPAMGYGPNGMGRVPPNAIMVFTVEVTAVH